MVFSGAGEDLTSIKIKCFRCGRAFRPYTTFWTCTKCKREHPNLTYYHRIAGIYFILVLLGAVLVLLDLGQEINSTAVDAAVPVPWAWGGPRIAMVEMTVLAILLAACAVDTYCTYKPWEGRRLMVAAWLVSAWGLAKHAVLPLQSGTWTIGQLLHPGSVLFFGFLGCWIWLTIMAWKCTVRESPGKLAGAKAPAGDSSRREPRTNPTTRR